MPRRKKSGPRAQTPSKKDLQDLEKKLEKLAEEAEMEQRWVKWAGKKISLLLRSITLLSLAAIYLNVSQLTLSPVFGAIPASIWHSRGVMYACLIGSCMNMFTESTLPYKPVKLLPVLAACIPLAQYTLFKYSGLMGGVYGPLIVESITVFPLLVLTISSTTRILDDLKMKSVMFPMIEYTAPGILSYAFYKFMESYSAFKLQETIGTSFFHTRLGSQLLLAGLYSLSVPSKLAWFTIFPLMHTLLFNHHVPTPWMADFVNSSLNANGWSLMARQESLTGYISVVENNNMGYRVMRCDHSLLGGEWLPSPPRSKTKEPIYTIFVMLEAVRLVEIATSVPDEEANALVV